MFKLSTLTIIVLYYCISIIAIISSMHASYKSLLSKLYKMNIINPVKLDLTNMIQLNNILRNPLYEIPVIHIAGTNGKGSVAYKLSASLTGLGIRTGLFTSPHISSFKERIQVNHTPLTDNDVIVSYT